MSAENKHEAKAARREQREADDQQRAFMAAVQFALHAGQATGNVPPEVLEDSVTYGEKLVQPGISLDDALEIEEGLRALRALLVYRKMLEGAPQVFEVTSVGEADGVTLTLQGVERGELARGARVVVTITRQAPEPEPG